MMTDVPFLLNTSDRDIEVILHLKAEEKEIYGMLYPMFAEQVYDLAMLSQRSFDKERMEVFLTRNNKILAKLGGMS